MPTTNDEQAPPDLAALGTGLRTAVIGATGGIGSALADRLDAHPSVAAVARLSRSGAGGGDALRLDLADEGSIAEAAARLGEKGPLHLVIVATGVLHDGDGLGPEKSWRDIAPEAMATAFRVNATGPALVAKHFLPLLDRDRRSVFAAVSARVGSIGDNRLGGWVAYRASKAALNMILRTLSIELARRNPQAICVGLHPGTVDTPLSKPFQRNVPDDRLFPPARSARHLLDVIGGLTPDDSGGVFAWDGSRIPP